MADPYDLWSHVTLYRDEWGVPHIYADNARAMAFAFGYAQAEDHLEGMLLAYRMANGRASEVLGESYAESDAFSIKMGHAQLAEQVWPQADPITRDICEGFALGVNVWLAEHHEEAPYWAEGVRPQDILSLFHAYLTSFAPFDLPDAYHRPRGTPSANAWAVSPIRSATGEAMLVINPHSDYTSPFQWYEAHLASHDLGLNVAGATLFGIPVIMQGHNEALGWALSPNDPDIGDLYLEPSPQFARNPAQINQPAIDPELVYQMRMLANTRTFYVRTPQGMRERYVQRMDTPRGPVIGRHQGRTVSFKVGGYHDFGALRQLVEMGRARSLVEFQSALALQQLPAFHVVYADRLGNIFYLYNAKVGAKFLGNRTQQPENPDNPNGNQQPELVNWREPVPGGDSRYAWGPVVPISALPSVLNPPSGYIQASGTTPWTVTQNAGLNPNDWPYWLVRDRDSFRAKRVRKLLGMGPRSFHDMQSMLYDVLAPFAAEAVPHLLNAAEARPELAASVHPDVPNALEILRRWNFVADSDSVGMTFFHCWWQALERMAPAALLEEGRIYEAIRGNAPDMQELSLRAAGEAARMLRNHYQSLNVRWGDFQRIQRGDIDKPLGGGIAGEPVFAAGGAGPDGNGGVWPVQRGYGFAMVVRFGDEPQAVSVLPFGVSQRSGSPHYADQLELMTERRFKTARFRHEDVQRGARRAYGRTLLLRPQGMEAQFVIRAGQPIQAGLESTIRAPEPLPGGLAPFTVFAETEIGQPAAQVMIEIDIYIPESIVDDEHFSFLHLWRLSPEGEWAPVEIQEQQPGMRTISAREHSPGVYAVLGPEQFLRRQAGDAPRPRGHIPMAPDFESPLFGPQTEPEYPVDQDELDPPLLQTLRPDQSLPWETALLEDAGVERPETPAPDAAEDGSEPMGIVPAEPPADPDAAPSVTYTPGGPMLSADGDEAPDPADFLRADPGAFPAHPAGEPGAPGPEIPPGVAGDMPRPGEPQPQPEPESEVLTQEPAPAEPPIQPADEPDGEPVIMYERPDGEAPAGQPARRFEMTGPPPAQDSASEQQAREQQPRGGAEGAESGLKAAGPMDWGRSVHVRGPGNEASFHVEAPSAVQARVGILSAPPAPLPSGMRAYSEYIALIRQPQVRVEAALTVRLPREAAESGPADELRLYYHDSQGGWREVEGQRFNPETGAFSALGGRAGVYAILGPS